MTRTAVRERLALHTLWLYSTILCWRLKLGHAQTHAVHLSLMRRSALGTERPASSRPLLDNVYLIRAANYAKRTVSRVAVSLLSHRTETIILVAPIPKSQFK